MSSSTIRNVEVIGLNELLAALKEIPEDLGKRTGREIARKGLAPMLEETQRLAPVWDGSTPSKSPTHGLLRERLRVKVTAKANGSSAQGKLVCEAPHAHLAEYGFIHTGHKPKKKRGGFVGQNAGGRLGPHPFMRPALDSQGDKAFEIAAEVIQKALTRYARRGLI